MFVPVTLLFVQNVYIGGSGCPEMETSIDGGPLTRVYTSSVALLLALVPRVRRQDVQGSSGATRGIRFQDNKCRWCAFPPHHR